MKTFKDKKAEKKFVEIIEAIDPALVAGFVEKVNKLRDTKITSEDGVYAEFYVTEKDLLELATA